MRYAKSSDTAPRRERTPSREEQVLTRDHGDRIAIKAPDRGGGGLLRRKVSDEAMRAPGRSRHRRRSMRASAQHPPIGLQQVREWHLQRSREAPNDVERGVLALAAFQQCQIPLRDTGSLRHLLLRQATLLANLPNGRAERLRAHSGDHY